MGENNEGIEVKITSQIERTANQVKLLTKSLEEAGYKLKNFKTNADSMGNTLITLANDNTTLKMKMDIAGNAVGEWTSKTKEATEVAKQASNATKSFKNTLGTAVNLGKFYLLWNLTKRIRDTLKDCVTQSIDFTETTNKFVVSMGSASKEATRFQNKLSEAFGTNRNEMMDFQSTFKNIMSSSAELSSQTAEKISESLTQMGLDYSSLFNTSQKSAMEKIQSALVGSIRPIRADSGYDISNKALVSTAQSLGVDKTSSQLTEMEKRLLRIITLMNQMKNTGAMQDLARTIESPANQIKVLNNQLQELKIALGNVFMGTIGQILPYINGFVMALRAVISALSVFFGWASGDNGGLEEAFEVANDGASGIASSLGAGAKSAKEIKKQLMGFDVLNVINTNKDKSGGSGGGAGGGAGVGTVDPKILNALKDYDSLMSKVRMKATDIRDRIMQWLGFMKIINPITGEVEWQLKNGYSNLKLILGILKTLAGLLIAKKAVQLVGALRNISKILKGETPTLKTFSSGLQGIKNLFTGTASSTKLLTSPLGKLSLVISGITLALDGARRMIKNWNTDLGDSTKMVTNAVIGFGELTAAGALIGTIFAPGVGTAIGAIAGAISSVALALVGYENTLNDIVEKNLFGSLNISQKEWSEMMRNSDGDLKKYTNNLTEYTNKVKGFYESFQGAEQELDRYATKFRISSYKITDEDLANIEKSIKTLGDNAINIIDESTNRGLSLLITTFEKTDGIVDDGEQSILDKVYNYGENQKSTIKRAQDNISETYKNAIEKRGYLTEQERKYIEDQLRKIEQLTNRSLSTTESNMEYLVQYTKNQTSQAGADVLNITKKSYEELTKATDKYREDRINKAAETYNTELNLLRNTLADGQISQEEYNTAVKKINDERTAYDKETEDKISNYKNEIFKGLYAKYVELNDKTDAESIKQRNTLTKMFKDAHIDFQSVYDGAIIAGTTTGQMFTKQVKDNTKINITGEHIKIDAASVKKKANELRTYFSIGNFHITSQGIKIGQYATGGLPDVGQMFVARESGPELVGKIGNQSAVVNNQQIVQAVSQGVAEAVSSVMGNVGGGSYNLYIDGRQITDVVQERINRNMNIAGA